MCRASRSPNQISVKVTIIFSLSFIPALSRLYSSCTRTQKSSSFKIQLVASASWDKTARLWDVGTGSCRSTLDGHSDFVSAVAFSPDGQLVASGSWDKTVRLWEVGKGSCYSILEGHLGSIIAIVFSPDGQLGASTSNDKTVRLWNTGTGSCCSTLESHSDYVSAVFFSPDSQLVASASNDTTFRLWDAGTGSSRSTLESHSDYVDAVVFSPDGQPVASASWDKMVRLWDVGTGSCISTLTLGRITSTLYFSPDSSHLITDRGQVPFSPTLSSSHIRKQKEPCAVIVRDQWVAFEEYNFLLFSSDHRATCTTVCENVICFGISSGHVMFLELNSQKYANAQKTWVELFSPKI